MIRYIANDINTSNNKIYSFYSLILFVACTISPMQVKRNRHAPLALLCTVSFHCITFSAIVHAFCPIIYKSILLCFSSLLLADFTTLDVTSTNSRVFRHFKGGSPWFKCIFYFYRRITFSPCCQIIHRPIFQIWREAFILFRLMNFPCIYFWCLRVVFLIYTFKESYFYFHW